MADSTCSAWRRISPRLLPSMTQTTIPAMPDTTSTQPTGHRPSAPSQQVLTVRVDRGSFLDRLWMRLSERLRTAGLRWKVASRGGTIGEGTRLQPPAIVYGHGGLRIGRRVSIWHHARLIAHNVEPGVARIEIGDGAAIHPYAHISAIQSVRIGAGALFASNVYISDHDHDWRDPDDPSISNGRVLASPVDIGPNVWLGERVCVLRGVTIGEGSIVGAGSVVTKDIPARCIAVGAPARVIRRWDAGLRRWVPVDAADHA